MSSEDVAHKTLTCALLVALRLESRHALTAAAEQVPLAVRLTQVGRRLLDGRVTHAHARRLHDGRHARARRGVLEDGEVQGHRRALDIIDPDREHGGAGALVVQRKIYTLSLNVHRARLCVNHRVFRSLERLVGRHHVHVAVRGRVPRGQHGVGKVRLGLVVQ